MSATAPMLERFEMIRQNRFRHIAFPNMAALSYLGQFLLPGTTTTFVADQGSGKSMLILQLMNDWLNATTPDQEPVLPKFLCLEGSPDQHQFRLLSQLSGNSKFGSVDFQNRHLDEVSAAYAENYDKLEQVARRMTFGSDKEWDAGSVLDWLEQNAAAGADVLIVDPITAMKISDRQWIGDHQFILAATALMATYRSRLILVTHPRSGSMGKPNLAGVAGGMAITRFVDNVFWMVSYPDEQEGKIDTSFGDVVKKFNRTIQIIKSRHGSGTGKKIAYRFEPETLRMSEVGRLAPEEKGR